MARGKERVQLRGTHTVVTGAASGIGLELCRILLEKGAASISMLDIDEKTLAVAGEELRTKAQGTKTQIYAGRVDVADEASVRQAPCRGASSIMLDGKQGASLAPSHRARSWGRREGAVKHQQNV